MKEVRVIVTGGAGFIGSHLVDCLIAKNFKVLVIDDLSRGNRKNLNPKAVFKKIDIRNIKKLTSCFKDFKPEFVAHLAGITSKSPGLAKKVRQVNLGGTINILKMCVRFKIKKLFFASSAAVYGEAKKFPIKENEKTSPLNPYAASKIAAEKQILSYAKKFHLPYSILRYANVYGPRQRADSEGGVISIFSNNILQKKPIKIFGDGTQTRDFIYVHDVTRANYLSLFSRSSFIANVSSNKEVSILKLARLIERLSGKKAKIIFKPKKAGEITKSRLDNFHLKHVLKWQPEVGVQTGLSKTLKYLDGK